jgi:hypothetical protein
MCEDKLSCGKKVKGFRVFFAALFQCVSHVPI